MDVFLHVLLATGYAKSTTGTMVSFAGKEIIID